MKMITPVVALLNSSLFLLLVLVSATTPVESHQMVENNSLVSFQVNKTRCHFWFYHYNSTLNCCQCIWWAIQCNGNKATVDSDFVATYDPRQTIISFVKSRRHQLTTNHTQQPGSINLPGNISELNNFMCGPLKRKGYLCSECIDGYGLSLGQWNSIAKCYNCSDN